MTAKKAPVRNAGKIKVLPEDLRRRVIQDLISRRIDIDQAAKFLRRSKRQVYRLLAKARDQGSMEIEHGNKGRPPANKIPEEVWDRITSWARQKGSFLSDHQLHLMMERELHIRVGRESLRKKLREVGIYPKVTRRNHS